MGTAAILFLLSRILFRFEGFATTISRYYESHIRVFQTTSSYVPLDRYPLPYKIFTFWFRPLPFEKSGLLYTVLTVENMILLIISAFAVYFAIRNFRKVIADQRIIFCALFLLFFSVMYVYAYANYGLIMRKRIMGFPFVAVVLMIALGSFRRRR